MDRTLLFLGLNLGQVPGGDDRNCGAWTALFLFSGLNLGQVPGGDDRNCGRGPRFFLFRVRTSGRCQPGVAEFLPRNRVEDARSSFGME